MTEGISVQYVFVDIKFDLPHFVDSVKLNFDSSQRLALVSTVQFAGRFAALLCHCVSLQLDTLASLHAAHAALSDSFAELIVPQARPLSAGEVLGCTSPQLQGDVDALLYVGDG